MKATAKNTAFTIVELLIVIVIIAILAAISVVAYNGIQNRARSSSGQSLANSIAKKVDIYYSLHSRYPTYNELRNNYAPGTTVANSGGAEARLDNPNAIVRFGLDSTNYSNGAVVEYDDCYDEDYRRVGYYNPQTGTVVNIKTYDECIYELN